MRMARPLSLVIPPAASNLIQSNERSDDFNQQVAVAEAAVSARRGDGNGPARPGRDAAGECGWRAGKGGFRHAPSHGLCLRAQWRVSRSMDAAGNRFALPVALYSPTLGPVSEGHPVSERTDARQGARQRGRPRRSRAGQRHLPHRAPGLQDRRHGHPDRRLHRSDRRPGLRRSDAPALAGIELRSRTQGGQLRFRLQLRLPIQHILAQRIHAHAAGGQSSPGFRTTLFRRRFGGGSGGEGAPPRERGQHPRFRVGGRQKAPVQTRLHGPPQAG